MSQVKDKIFFDSDPEKAWFKTFEALMIKNRDHRRILNRQPEIMPIKIDTGFGFTMFYEFLYERFINSREIVKVKDWNIDFKILNN
jgi:hypothetical protein